MKGNVSQILAINLQGWDDVPLATDGVEEARRAGQLLRLHGFEFDAVYTSWLSRAIETAWLVMDEMDCLWLPIIKSWRLNERMVCVVLISIYFFFLLFQIIVMVFHRHSMGT